MHELTVFFRFPFGIDRFKVDVVEWPLDQFAF
jgi:hypothetical protein